MFYADNCSGMSTENPRSFRSSSILELVSDQFWIDAPLLDFDENDAIEDGESGSPEISRSPRSSSTLELVSDDSGIDAPLLDSDGNDAVEEDISRVQSFADIMPDVGERDIQRTLSKRSQIKWGQICFMMLMLIMVALYIYMRLFDVSEDPTTRIITGVTISSGLYGAVGVVAHNNFSFVVFTKLAKQPTFWLLCMYLVLYMVMEVCLGASKNRGIVHSLSYIFWSQTYVAPTITLVLFDAVIVKSRKFVIATASICVSLNIYLICETYFDKGNPTWFKAWGVPVSFHSIYRSVHYVTTALLFDGLVTLIRDKESKRFMFVQSNVRRTDVHDNAAGFSHSDLDEKRSKRVGFGQISYLAALISGIALRFIVPHTAEAWIMLGLGYTIAGWGCFWMIGWQNFSVQIFRRLLREPKLWLVSMYMLLNIVVMTWYGARQGGAELGISASGGWKWAVAWFFMAQLVVCPTVTLILFDALKVKSRYCILAAGCWFTGFMLYFIIFTFRVIHPVAWFRVGGHDIYFQEIKQTIFIGIVTLLFDGLVTLFTDSSSTKIMFVQAKVEKKAVLLTDREGVKIILRNYFLTRNKFSKAYEHKPM